MLFRNDIFKVDGQLCRLLHIEDSTDSAWTIDIQDKSAFPRQRAWSQIRDLTSVDLASRASSDSSVLGKQKPLLTISATDSMKAARDAALARLGDLHRRTPDIFDAATRGQLVASRAQEVGCSRTSLYKDLRRYWTGGQTSAALLANFHLCGKAQATGTNGRGRKYKHSNMGNNGVNSNEEQYDSQPYQLTAGDQKNIREAIDKHYLKDARVRITHAFQTMLENKYTMLDGNGTAWVLPVRERPSLRQFEYFLRTNYSLEKRIRRREGDKDFERDHRATLGTVLDDCLGVGHYYEIDASISDVYLVATQDVRQIVGKPTIYLIYDRQSRLIVGWYVGLENASWASAKQAILSIAADKALMCERYDVQYDPEDWPAHMVFPKEFLADRGEMVKRASNQIADDLEVTVTNVPAKRADWKPVVESGIKQHRVALEDRTPGFDPPENAKRRQGKHYEKDACLTLQQFGTIVLNFIIAHNRSQMRHYELSLKELADSVEPSPIALWNHNIRERAGLLPRFDEERVRLALLPRDEAVVSADGIEFKGCYYTCKHATDRGWFIQGRKHRFGVQVSYDSGIVNRIYVHSPDARGQVLECELTRQSEKYAGLSFAEVQALVKLRKQQQPAIEQSRIQTRADMHRANQPIIDKAKQTLKKAGTGISRSARRADTKEARKAELRRERLGTFERSAHPSGTEPAVQGHENVIALPTSLRAIPAHGSSNGGVDSEAGSVPSTAPPGPAPTAKSTAQKLQELRQRMHGG